MADISAIKLPDGNTYDIKDTSKSNATNWVNGSQDGSVRTVGSATEDNNYTMGTYAVAEGYDTKTSGYSSHAEGASTTASGNVSHAEGGGTTASGLTSHAEGSGSTASGSASHAEGSSTIASGSSSHAEGFSTLASGNYSHAEGGQNKAYGNHSHVEGYSTTTGSSNDSSKGTYAHAEGVSTTASGSASHAEGGGTTASGYYSHAEGSGTTASGQESHAEGGATIANHLAQHVFGQYNIADDSTAAATAKGNYIEIVGNGTLSARSNARTLDWSGNEVLAGKLTVGVAGTNSLDVATIGQLPTKTSDLTNDSGFITSDSDEKVKITSTSATNRYYLTFLDTGNTPITKGLNVHVGNLVYKNDGTTTAIEIGSSSFKGAIHLKTATGSAYGVSIEPGSLTSSRVVTLPDKDGTIALTSDIPDVSGFVTTETDPVFSASAAAGITSTDISNWNAKISDDKTWNGVSLTKSENTGGTPLYATILAATSATGASLLKITQTPTSGKIAQYDSNAYLHSTTPSANDNSTKVATTAYVDNAVGSTSIPIASNSTLGGIKVGQTLDIDSDGILNTNIYPIYITAAYDYETETYTLTPSIPLVDIVELLEQGKDVLLYLKGDKQGGPYQYFGYNSMDYNYYFKCNDVHNYGDQIRIYSYNEEYEISYYSNTSSQLLIDNLTYGALIYSGKLQTLNNDQTTNDLLLQNKSGTIALTSDIPSVPSWALQSTKPSYTASEVGAQPTLVSGTNIKTVNNQSLLGSGNLTITGGSQVQIVRWTENLTTT